MMITELTIQNYKSIREPTTICFAAGTTARLSGNLLRLSNRERYVKSMALYGPNASGKTTVLDALYALRAFVLFSSQDQRPTAVIPRFEPYALDEEFSKRPARICSTLDLEGDRFTFDVSATSRQVWSESLKVRRLTKQPSRKSATKHLLKRTWDSQRNRYLTELDGSLGSELTLAAAMEQTTPNRLILGKLATLNSDLAYRVTEWFEKSISFYDMHRNPFSEDTVLEESARLLKEDPGFAETVTRLLRDADTGIQDIHITNEKTVEHTYNESANKLESQPGIKPALSFRHTTEDGSEVVFRRHRESSGTLRFVALAVAILQSSVRRRLICIDELSASMHPELVRRLLRVVHSSRYNKSGNQLIFTTHDTHLIDPAELLRRDQVTICTKDRFGKTVTRRLDDYQDAARTDANLQKQYLQGRFGGLPQFGPSLEDVPVDDDPMEA